MVFLPRNIYLAKEDGLSVPGMTQHSTALNMDSCHYQGLRNKDYIQKSNYSKDNLFDLAKLGDL